LLLLTPGTLPAHGLATLFDHRCHRGMISPLSRERRS
jgi:hypothetical protein